VCGVRGDAGDLLLLGELFALGRRCGMGREEEARLRQPAGVPETASDKGHGLGRRAEAAPTGSK